MANEQVLHADIVAEDDASAQLRKVKGEFDKLKTSAHGLNAELRENARGFAYLAERSEVVRDHFGELGHSFGETNERLAEMLPLFAVFGAAASATGLVELTRETAEARTQLAAMALELGISTQALQGLRLAARETDVPVEAMQTGMVKLQRSMVDAASGKNKTAGEIFARMGIGLRDAHGHMRNVNDVLPLVAESLRRTNDSTLRNAVAMQLFGRAGAELIPFLNLGRAGMQRLSETSERLSANFSAEDTENIEAYKNAWIELDTAVDGLKDTVTADVSPVLTPLLNQLRDYVAAHKEEIGKTVREDIVWLRDELKSIDFKAIGEDLHEVAKAANEVAGLAGGWKTVIEGLVLLGALKFTLSVARPVAQIAILGKDISLLVWRLNRDLVGAWANVGRAAETAGGKESAAASVGTTGRKKPNFGEPTAVATERRESKEFADGFIKKVGAGAVTSLLGFGEFLLLDAAFDAATHPVQTYHALKNAPTVPSTHDIGFAVPGIPGSGGYGWDDLQPAKPVVVPVAASDQPAVKVAMIKPEPSAREIIHAKPASDEDTPRPPSDDAFDAAVREASRLDGPSPGSTAEQPSTAVTDSGGAVTVNIKFDNTPDGMMATMETTGSARAGSIDYGKNQPFGGF